MSQAAIDAVTDLRIHIPECFGAGIVDLSTGLLLAVDLVESHPRVVLDMLADTTADLFQGRNVLMIEDMFKRHRGVRDDVHYFQEILVNSDSMCHLFIRGRALPDLVGVAVADRAIPLGALFDGTRAAMRRLEAAVLALPTG